MDNKNLYCKAFFNYEHEGNEINTLPEWVQKLTERYFMDARNEAVELLNPHYEEWNAEYGVSNIKGEDDKDYLAFIQKKQQDILDSFNKTWIGPVKLYSDEYADIAGRFKVLGETFTMHLSLKLLNEEEWKKENS